MRMEKKYLFLLPLLQLFQLQLRWWGSNAGFLLLHLPLIQFWQQQVDQGG